MPDQRPEEQRPDQHQVHVHQLVHVRRVQRRVVPAGEVERPRAEHEQQRTSAAGRSAPSPPASAAPRAAIRAECAAACAAPASPAHRGRGTAAPPSTAPCAAPCARTAASCRTPRARTRGDGKQAHARPTKRTCARRATGPRARAAARHPTGRGPSPRPSATVSTGSSSHAVKHPGEPERGQPARSPVLEDLVGRRDGTGREHPARVLSAGPRTAGGSGWPCPGHTRHNGSVADSNRDPRLPPARTPRPAQHGQRRAPSSGCPAS